MVLRTSLAAAVVAIAAQAAAPLPEVTGWRKAEAAKTFGPTDLFEHINGAAESFLEFNFQELTVQAYENAEKKWLTVEIYRHDSPLNAFGVYSQEKPVPGTFLAVGAQGYYDEGGVLNFLKGAHYVKLNAGGLGPKGREALTAFAAAIARDLPGEERLPALLQAFPREGKVEHSERFTLNNVLGYACLRMGYSAEYRRGDQACRAWVISPGDARAGDEMLAAYARVQAMKAVPKAGEILAFNDKFNGPLTLLWTGRHLLVASGADAAFRGTLLDGLRRGLPAA